jgi:hypothetical protein
LPVTRGRRGKFRKWRERLLTLRLSNASQSQPYLWLDGRGTAGKVGKWQERLPSSRLSITMGDGNFFKQAALPVAGCGGAAKSETGKRDY